MNEVVKRVDGEHKAEVFRQDALRVKNRRCVHPDHAQDVPEELHVPEEHHGGGEQQAQAVGEKDQAEQEEKCQNRGFLEPHAGEQADQDQGDERDPQVDD